MLETYLKLLDTDYFEIQEAFRGLQDAHVWLRPAKGLLSIGEIAGHVAYWEALRLAGDAGVEEEDLSRCAVTSPLIDKRFRYYTTGLETAPSGEHLAMSAEQVCKELVRVHEESVAIFKAKNVDLSSKLPGSEHWTYGSSLEYLAFHVAYHTGQIYTIRHLLGEETPDN